MSDFCSRSAAPSASMKSVGDISPFDWKSGLAGHEVPPCDELLRRQYGLLLRKNSWHPSLSSPDSGLDSPSLYDRVSEGASKTPETAASSSTSDPDSKTVELNYKRSQIEKQLRFLGCTMNAGNPCDTIVCSSPDWTWVARPEGRLKSLFRVEWRIGNASSVSLEPV